MRSVRILITGLLFAAVALGMSACFARPIHAEEAPACASGMNYDGAAEAFVNVGYTVMADLKDSQAIKFVVNTGGGDAPWIGDVTRIAVFQSPAYAGVYVVVVFAGDCVIASARMDQADLELGLGRPV